MEKEAEAARKVAEEWEKAHPEQVQRIENVMGAHWEKGKDAEFRGEINKHIEPELERTGHQPQFYGLAFISRASPDQRF
jgi:hypothetical protein